MAYKRKEIFHLKEEIDEEIKTYNKEKNKIVASLNLATQEYNAEINVINSKTDLLWRSSIVKMGNFLKQIGFFEEIQYKNYINERILEVPKLELDEYKKLEHFFHDKDFNEEANMGEYEIENPKMSKLKETGNFLNSILPWEKSYADGEKKENIKLSNDGRKKLEEFKTAIENEKIKCQEEKNFLNTGIKIASNYRVTMEIVDTAIQEKIIPELELISALLTAEAIKNKIFSEEKITNEKIESVELSVLADTIYNKHFLFVQNIFLYYTLISKFFTEKVITNLMEAIKNDEQDNEKKFDEEISIIEEETKKIEENIL